jgi:methylated-DNA-[protein]-cysteine S-methyltransferase
VAIAVLVLSSPFGPVHVAVDARAVVALELMTTTDAFRMSVARRTGSEVTDGASVPAGQRRLLVLVERQVDEYLEGRRRSFDLPLELSRLGAWDRRVLAGVRRVPYGEVTSYGRLARAIGARGAARAVGGAVGRNPIGLLVPCHRVIAGDGSLGGYGGSWAGTQEASLALKRSLLRTEGVELPARSFAE